MFEVPDAKRVRREDLHASDESSWSESEADAELEARLNAQIAKSLGLDDRVFRAPKPQITVPVITKLEASDRKEEEEELSSDEESEPSTPVEDSPANESGEAGDEVYAFRLFSTAGPAPNVVLENTDRVEEGKLVRGRPLSYYLVTDLSPEKKQQYEMAAMSGEDVLEQSKVRTWGLELPWRVKTVKITRKAGPRERENLVQVEDGQQAKRKRPGKKSRVAMRIKARAETQAAEAAKQKMAEKEEHLKDKKKRLNRLRKLKRKAKKKADKEENGDAGGGSDEDSSDGE